MGENEEENPQSSEIEAKELEISTIESAVEAVEETKQELALYESASQLKITQAEKKKLLADMTPEMVEIRPDGIVYLPGVFFRRILQDAFGPGQWCLMPVNSLFDKTHKRMTYHGRLYIRGHFIAESVGEQSYSEQNTMTSYATALEGAKTDCLTRCCKDIGIGSELWMPQFQRQWRGEHADFVQVIHIRTGKTDAIWLKKGCEPVYPYRRPKGATPVDFEKHPIPDDIAQWFYDDGKEPAEVETIVSLPRYRTRDGEKPDWTSIRNDLEAKDEKRRKGESDVHKE